ncbi:uncharacterized protein LOC124921707 [Impatiens glandulifera]|uniref:uncharacterized protein LOC124921707 n=1 Tax=Impatiens glandulifera TaxID=253017 RepID=UPI001FB0F3C8|nr:uncharacterized protein LOC124921707 [Impatiens glandulifera]
MELEKPSKITCSVVAIDHTNMYYTVCSCCERTLFDPNNGGQNPSSSSSSTSQQCKYCTFNNSINPGSKRVFRILMSIATDSEVFSVIMFDRIARVLFGCSADQFFDLTKLHPRAAVDAGRTLEGELLRVTLSKPKNGNAQHLRVVNVVPFSSVFQPVFPTLKQHYRLK